MDGPRSLSLPVAGFPPPTSWEAIRRFLLADFQELVRQAPAQMRGLVRPIKKNLRENREIIIYFSCRASEETYRHAWELPPPRTSAEQARDLAGLYRRILEQVMKLAINLQFRAGQAAPATRDLLETCFLALYESEGPDPAETPADEAAIDPTVRFLAHRFFLAAGGLRESENSMRSTMGVLYNQVWQTGEFIVRNRFRGSEGRKPGKPWVPRG